jgi:hypothetical protein
MESKSDSKSSHKFYYEIHMDCLLIILFDHFKSPDNKSYFEYCYEIKIKKFCHKQIQESLQKTHRMLN